MGLSRVLCVAALTLHVVFGQDSGNYYNQPQPQNPPQAAASRPQAARSYQPAYNPNAAAPQGDDANAAANPSQANPAFNGAQSQPQQQQRPRLPAPPPISIPFFAVKSPLVNGFNKQQVLCVNRCHDSGTCDKLILPIYPMRDQTTFQRFKADVQTCKSCLEACLPYIQTVKRDNPALPRQQENVAALVAAQNFYGCEPLLYAPICDRIQTVKMLAKDDAHLQTQLLLPIAQRKRPPPPTKEEMKRECAERNLCLSTKFYAVRSCNAISGETAFESETYGSLWNNVLADQKTSCEKAADDAPWHPENRDKQPQFPPHGQPQFPPRGPSQPAKQPAQAGQQPGEQNSPPQANTQQQIWLRQQRERQLRERQQRERAAALAAARAAAGGQQQNPQYNKPGAAAGNTAGTYNSRPRTYQPQAASQPAAAAPAPSNQWWPRNQ